MSVSIRFLYPVHNITMVTLMHSFVIKCHLIAAELYFPILLYTTTCAPARESPGVHSYLFIRLLYCLTSLPASHKAFDIVFRVGLGVVGWDGVVWGGVEAVLYVSVCINFC